MPPQIWWVQALKSNGVSKYDALGEKFDPNMHSALFEIPDPSKAPGTIGVVTKVSHALLNLLSMLGPACVPAIVMLLEDTL